jgi:hypothetical protein
VVAARSLTWEEKEILACAADFEYWVRRYVKIYDAEAMDWIPFDLWPEQVKVAQMIEDNQQSLFLKARQLGLTWLVLAFILHGMLFRPIFVALIFSKREDEALYLLGEERLKGMYKKLPEWMQARAITVDAAKHIRLSNGSSVRAFPSNAGDSYTATFAFIDEADLVPDLKQLLGRVKPTIDAGGKIVMVSRVDKSKPQSIFKQIYRAAKQHLNEWATMFLSWRVHPGRTQEWYDKQQADTLHNTGALDDLHEQYPETDGEALAGKTLDKRFAPSWVQQCYQEARTLELKGALPSIPGLLIYRVAEIGHRYVIGIDPAEGNPTSDDSALTVLDQETQEEVAHLSGKFQPSVIAGYADTIGQYFNNADVLVERNNHGHAVILWLDDNSPLTVLLGPDEKKGWHSTTLGKVKMYDAGADALKNEETAIHTFKTFIQLQSIEGSTLRAPEGEMDDGADSYVLALVGNLHTGADWEAVLA